MKPGMDPGITGQKSEPDRTFRCEDLTVTYGPFVALNGTTLSLAQGFITSVIGPNGAGKTTLINALCGLVPVARGEVYLDGQRVTHLPPHRRARLGIARSFQIVNIFRGMTVKQNFEVAAQAQGFEVQPFWRTTASFPQLANRAQEVMELVGLSGRSGDAADGLSHGEQRALEMGLSLVANPRVLLLDEPLAGVGHGNLENMIDLIRRVSVGRTVLLVEHNMDAVMSLSHEVYVMTEGSVLAHGSPEKIRLDERVRIAYLGRTPS